MTKNITQHLWANLKTEKKSKRSMQAPRVKKKKNFLDPRQSEKKFVSSKLIFCIAGKQASHRLKKRNQMIAFFFIYLFYQK